MGPFPSPALPSYETPRQVLLLNKSQAFAKPTLLIGFWEYSLSEEGLYPTRVRENNGPPGGNLYGFEESDALGFVAIVYLYRS